MFYFRHWPMERRYYAKLYSDVRRKTEYKHQQLFKLKAEHFIYVFDITTGSKFNIFEQATATSSWW